MSDPSDGTQGFDPNTEIARDFDGCCGQGACAVIIALVCIILACCAYGFQTPPGTVITLEAGGYAGGFRLTPATVNLYVVNNLPECFVLDGRPFPGTRCVWVDQLTRRRQSGVELLGNLIAVDGGSIISDSCLPTQFYPIPASVNPPAQEVIQTVPMSKPILNGVVK